MSVRDEIFTVCLRNPIDSTPAIVDMGRIIDIADVSIHGWKHHCGNDCYYSDYIEEFDKRENWAFNSNGTGKNITSFNTFFLLRFHHSPFLGLY